MVDSENVKITYSLWLMTYTRYYGVLKIVTF